MKKYYSGGTILLLLLIGAFFYWRHTTTPVVLNVPEGGVVTDDLADLQLRQAVIGYLENDFLKPTSGGKVFCSIGWTESLRNADSWKIYTAHLCHEYRFESGALVGGTGSSGAIALEVEEKKGSYKITGHEVPRDGSDYAEDFLRIFPKDFVQATNDRGQAELSAMIQGLDAQNIYRARAALQGISAPATREAALGFIQIRYPELASYPSDILPPRSITSESLSDGWYLAFIQNGSGRPILSARCFKVAVDGLITSTGEYTPQGTPEPLTISAKTCQ